MITIHRLALTATLLAAIAMTCSTQTNAQVNYDEAKVPKYTLPDPLVMTDGTKVTSAEMWRTKRRPEIYKLFQEHVYGTMPPARKIGVGIAEQRPIIASRPRMRSVGYSS